MDKLESFVNKYHSSVKNVLTKNIKNTKPHLQNEVASKEAKSDDKLHPVKSVVNKIKDNKLLNENLNNLIKNTKKNNVTSPNKPNTNSENKLTRSSSINEKKGNKISTVNKELTRSKTAENLKKNDKLSNLNKTFLPKAAYLLNNKLKFKKDINTNTEDMKSKSPAKKNEENNIQQEEKNVRSDYKLRSSSKKNSSKNSVSKSIRESPYKSIKNSETKSAKNSVDKSIKNIETKSLENPSEIKSIKNSESKSIKSSQTKSIKNSATKSLIIPETKSINNSETKSPIFLESNNKNSTTKSGRKSAASKSSETKVTPNITNLKTVSTEKIDNQSKLKNRYSNVKSKVGEIITKRKEKVTKKDPVAKKISTVTTISNNIKAVKIQRRTTKLLEEQNKKKREGAKNLVKDDHKDNNKDRIKENNNEVITNKKSSLKKTTGTGKNFVKMNLKRGYSEKKVTIVKNIKKVKIDREKNIQKYKKNLLKNIDDKYLGKGKLGLEEPENEEEIANISFKGSKNNSHSKQGKGTPSLFDSIQQQVPYFSEGYYYNILEETKMLSAKKDEENINPQNLVDGGKEDTKIDVSNIKMPRPGRTPNRALLTNKLQTALKSSLKKNVSLDTELRILSREFRFLLSGKRKEADESQANMMVDNEPVEKRLNFNDGVKQEEGNMNMIQDQPEQEKQAAEEEDDSNEHLTQEEVEKLENDILLKVLEENFGYKSFLPGQLECIKNLFNNKNTLAILPPAGGKSLCFQLPALVSEGLTIVVSPLLALITDQITNLPQCLSGAGLTSFTNYKQRNEIFEAIKSRKIKILFITPERFSIENFSEIDEISLICFDEASCVCPLSQSYRPSYASIQHIVKRLKPNVLLFLSNNMTKLIEENLHQQYKIDSVVRENITIPKHIKLYVSKEENKLQGLVKLLKTQQFKNIPTLIFCNFKRNVDKVTSYLNQSGLSASSYHSGKSEMDRQIIQTNFMHDKIKLIVCTSSFSMGISKNDIRLIVVFDIPNSIESFLQQVGRGGRDKKETYVHVILNDDDYFAQRNFIYLDNIDKKHVVKFLDHLTHLINFVPGTSNIKSLKRNFSEAFENHPIFNSDIPLPKTISVNFSNASEASGIKKQTQLYLLLSLYNQIISETPDYNEDNLIKFNCLGIGPSVISIRFYKSTPEVLAEAESNIKLILESSREYQGNWRFNTMEVCEKIGISHTDLINYLYNLQSQGEIGYECKEEGIFLVIEKVPDSFKDVIKFMHDKIQFFINLNLIKLNASYVIMRKFAINSIDNLLNNVLKIGKPGPIKCMTMYSDYSQYETEFIEHFEKYFKSEDGKKKA